MPAALGRRGDAAEEAAREQVILVNELLSLDEDA